VIFNIVCSCLMILIYSATMYKVSKGTSYSFIKKLIMLLMLSNIASLVLTYVG